MKTQYQEQGMVEWDLRKPFEMQLNDTDGDKFETLQVRLIKRKHSLIGKSFFFLNYEILFYLR